MIKAEDELNKWNTICDCEDGLVYCRKCSPHPSLDIWSEKEKELEISIFPSFKMRVINIIVAICIIALFLIGITFIIGVNFFHAFGSYAERIHHILSFMHKEVYSI